MMLCVACATCFVSGLGGGLLLVVDFAASKLVLKIFIYAPLGGRAIIIRIECVSGGCRGLRKVRTLVVSA